MLVDELKAIRAKAGLTQTQLAEAAGITQGAVSQIERWRQLPTPANLEHVMTACKVSARQRSKLIMMWFDEAVEQG